MVCRKMVQLKPSLGCFDKPHLYCDRDRMNSIRGTQFSDSHAKVILHDALVQLQISPDLVGRSPIGEQCEDLQFNWIE
jgi:hypothetical protein